MDPTHPSLRFTLAQIVGAPQWGFPINLGNMHSGLSSSSTDRKHRSGTNCDSMNIKDAVNFWESFQCLGAPGGRQNGKGNIGALSQAATFEQILANWEFRGRAGKNATLEDVVNYAVNRVQRQTAKTSRTMKNKHRKARSNAAAPYPASRTLTGKMSKSHREKMNRQKVNDKFHALCDVVSSDSRGRLDKSSVLSEAIRIIDSLREENACLEKEKQKLYEQCQSVSRCLSAGLSQLERHKAAASAAAAAAASRHRGQQQVMRQRTVVKQELNSKHGGQERPTRNSRMQEDLSSTPPPPPNPNEIPIPKLKEYVVSSPSIRHMRRRSDSLQRLILQQRREPGMYEISTDSRPYVEERKNNDSPSPMEDVDFTFKPLFDDVLSSLPKAESFDDLLRPSMLFK